MQRISLLLRHNKQVKPLQIRKSINAQDLGFLVAGLFDIKDKVIGLTDKQSKIYDLEWIIKNSQYLPKGEPLSILTQTKQSTQSVLSFGTQKSRCSGPVSEHQRVLHSPESLIYRDQEHTQLNSTQTNQQPLGLIADLPAFEFLFLEQQGITVVLLLRKDTDLRKFRGIRYFLKQVQNKQRAIIYYGRKRTLEVPLSNWNFLQSRIRQLQSRTSNEEEEKSNYSFEPSKSFTNYLNKMHQDGFIDQNQFYRLKCHLLQNHRAFCQLHNLRQDIQYEEFANLVSAKLVQVESRGWTGSADLRGKQNKESKEPYRNQIPIIVRRNGNVIQKINSDWPLNLDQQKYVQVVNELQLKGLLDQHHQRVVRSMILEESLQVGRLIAAYIQKELDQVNLSKALRQIVEKRKQRAFTPDTPQARSQMLTKLLENLIKNQQQKELLLNLAEQHNKSLLAAFQVYLVDGNEEDFLQKMKKIQLWHKQPRQFDVPQFGLKNL